MFRCERCGSSYSAMHAVALQNCPRCLVRDGIEAPLTFKAFTLPEEFEPKPGEGEDAESRRGEAVRPAS